MPRPVTHADVVCMIDLDHTHEGPDMRTNIEIDDDLMKDALAVTGLKTKREVVELGLRTLVRLEKQKELLKLRGKLHWEGEHPSEQRRR